MRPIIYASLSLNDDKYLLPLTVATYLFWYDYYNLLWISVCYSGFSTRMYSAGAPVSALKPSVGVPD